MKKHILVANSGHLFDENRFRRLLDKNYSMHWASSCQDALRPDMLRNADGLMMDLDLPWPEGQAVLPQAREGNPSLLILGFTERSDLSVIAATPGLSAVVEKPVHIPRLLRLIEDLFKRSPEKGEGFCLVLQPANRQTEDLSVPPREHPAFPAPYSGWGINE